MEKRVAGDGVDRRKLLPPVGKVLPGTLSRGLQVPMRWLAAACPAPCRVEEQPAPIWADAERIWPEGGA